MNSPALPDSPFFDVARTVYREDPFWLGESETEILAQFRREADQPGRRIWWQAIPGTARLAVSIGPDQVIDGQPTAFFGFWESLDNPEANRQLFAEAEDWARDQGARRMLGPINFSTFFPYRVRLSHFASGAFPGEPYNPPYYPALLEALGYRVEKRFHSWLGPIAGRPARLAPQMEPLVDSLKAEGLVFTRLDGDTWLSRLDAFYDYVDQIFGNNYAYRGIDRDSFRRGLGEPIARRLCPHSSVLVQDPAGELAGFFIGFPDYGSLLRHNNPRRLAPEAVHAGHLADLESPLLLGKTGGVHPAYREKGLFAAMSYRMMALGEPHYVQGGAVLVREDNPSARVARLCFSGPEDQRRDYALFAREL